MRLALGTVLGIGVGKMIKNIEAFNASDYVVLGIVLFATIVNYWPEPKGVQPEDRG